MTSRTPRSRRRTLLAGAAALALAGSLAVAAPGLAATPDRGTVSPTQPTVQFQGRPTPAGANVLPTAGGGVACPAQDPNALCDRYTLTVDVDPSYWKANSGGIKLTVNWASTSNDFDVFVYDSNGKLAASSASSSKPEVVSLSNPSGVYSVRIAPFAVVNDQTSGLVEFLSAPKPADNPLFPNGDPQGLAFSATIPSDPQRSQGEPAVTADLAGRLYSCGPTGFSSINDFATVSTDGGDQFHLVGSAPRGQVSTAEGGGDCALATAPVKNGKGDYQLAYAGLGPLTNFSTATSADGGKTLVGSPVSESYPGVDRQWITFLDDKTTLFTYNAMIGTNTPTGGKAVQRSDDGGLTYGPARIVTPDSGRIGQIRSYLPPGKTDRLADSVVYIPYANGTKVKMVLSQDAGKTWSTCTVLDAGVPPTGGFVAADHDNAGNIYFTYTEKGGGRDTYLVPVPASRLSACSGNADLKQPKTRVNTLAVETTLFPWVAARGMPGRVAVTFYGTDQVGDPDSSAFKAAWNVYVTQSLDALDAQPTVAMVQVSTHPFHYDSICTNGLGCSLSGGDRSLVDYYTMEQNVADGYLAIVYEQAAKKPNEAAGHVATPAVVTQVAGPSNNGGFVDRGFRQQVLRSSSPDPAGDAIAGYSVLNTGTSVVSPPSNPVPALDLVDGPDGSPAVSVDAERDPTGAVVDNGGFTVTLRVKDLSTAALQAALTKAGSPTGTGVGQSLVYLFRFVDGYQSAGVSARWDPSSGFDYAYTGYQTKSVQCLSSGEECTTYDKEVALTGSADQTTGTITINVPLRLLTALGPADAANRPSEVPARPGDRIYDATAVTLINPSAKDQQSFMEQVDGAAAFDFLIPTLSPSPAVPEVPVAALVPVLGLAAGGALLLARRRRTSSPA